MGRKWSVFEKRVFHRQFIHRLTIPEFAWTDVKKDENLPSQDTQHGFEDLVRVTTAQSRPRWSSG
jgi:hypothetical protein